MKEERHKRFTPDVCHMKHCGSRLADRRPPVARWETYLRVRSNRHVRISTRNLKPRRRTPEVVLQDMTENKDHDTGEHSFVERMDTGQNTVETDSCKMPETEENSTVNIRLASTKTEDPSPEAKVVQIDENADFSGLISVLQVQLQQLQKRRHSLPTIKCQQCQDLYVKPVVSVCCWHVHCERCWLQTLGVKRVCPQCDTITFPSDLRRLNI
ncbi:uncharacterized protein LOC143245201 [Tachypleus tridentatus]|uniref:uncharacterized protein LOC143245201 n=1 Tax=Tachypleus tridentatus TaxID=6853 RepID=UPI003FD499A5